MSDTSRCHLGAALAQRPDEDLPFLLDDVPVGVPDLQGDPVERAALGRIQANRKAAPGPESLSLQRRLVGCPHERTVTQGSVLRVGAGCLERHLLEPLVPKAVESVEHVRRVARRGIRNRDDDGGAGGRARAANGLHTDGIATGRVAVGLHTDHVRARCEGRHRERVAATDRHRPIVPGQLGVGNDDRCRV